jgi:hypothetical protein
VNLPPSKCQESASIGIHIASFQILYNSLSISHRTIRRCLPTESFIKPQKIACRKGVASHGLRNVYVKSHLLTAVLSAGGTVFYEGIWWGGGSIATVNGTFQLLKDHSSVSCDPILVFMVSAPGVTYNKLLRADLVHARV